MPESSDPQLPRRIGLPGKIIKQHGFYLTELMSYNNVVG